MGKTPHRNACGSHAIRKSSATLKLRNLIAKEAETKTKTEKEKPSNATRNRHKEPRCRGEDATTRKAKTRVHLRRCSQPLIHAVRPTYPPLPLKAMDLKGIRFRPRCMLVSTGRWHLCTPSSSKPVRPSVHPSKPTASSFVSGLVLPAATLTPALHSSALCRWLPWPGTAGPLSCRVGVPLWHLERIRSNTRLTGLWV